MYYSKNHNRKAATRRLLISWLVVAGITAIISGSIGFLLGINAYGGQGEVISPSLPAIEIETVKIPTPEPEPPIEELEPDNQPNIVSLGTYKLTAYCPCYKCSEGWGRQTSTGVTARASHTVAVDPKVIPYGTQIMINGVDYTAEDCGGGVKGQHIDIFFDTHREAKEFGIKYAEVLIERSN